MKKMKSLDVLALKWFEDKDASQWSRAYFTPTSKCDVLLNNMCKVFNSFILDARNKPILTIMPMIKDLIMVRMQMNRDKAGHGEGKLCPKPRAKLIKYVKDAMDCMPMKCDRAHFQVYSGGSTNQWVVDLDKK
ncbi:hypothetical protein LIER_35231 [Lithospermum erythrorhizon]|uniref:Uncharacterized protein n=1 Tax=Lithospermum erythrorhizon TaxID=34254 RepID=A0AAV3NMV2_LITER